VRFHVKVVFTSLPQHRMRSPSFARADCSDSPGTICLAGASLAGPGRHPPQSPPFPLHSFLERGLTRAQLGQRLGIGQVGIVEIEAKPGRVSIDQLVKLLSLLGAGLVLRDLESSAASAQARTAPEEASVATRPVSRKKSSAVAGTARNTVPGLRIAAKKGSW
jgi:transcriptional regulator with XRE-family HTH domain